MTTDRVRLLLLSMLVAAATCCGNSGPTVSVSEALETAPKEPFPCSEEDPVTRFLFLSIPRLVCPPVFCDCSFPMRLCDRANPLHSRGLGAKNEAEAGMGAKDIPKDVIGMGPCEVISELHVGLRVKPTFDVLRIHRFIAEVLQGEVTLQRPGKGYYVLRLRHSAWLGQDEAITRARKEPWVISVGKGCFAKRSEKEETRAKAICEARGKNKALTEETFEPMGVESCDEYLRISKCKYFKLPRGLRELDDQTLGPEIAGWRRRVAAATDKDSERRALSVECDERLEAIRSAFRGNPVFEECLL